MNKPEMLQFLRQSVVPALGCTEPVCAALAAADAVCAVKGEVKSVRLSVSRNIYKNGVSAGIAGFPHVGLNYAAALGAYIADTESGLEIMEKITPAIAARAIALVEGGNVAVTVDENESGVYVRCAVSTSLGEGESVIRGSHTNIVETSVNGKTVFSGARAQAAPSDGQALLAKLTAMRICNIRALVASASEEELAFLAEGIEMNERLADYGIEQSAGLGIGATLSAKNGANLLGGGLMERVMVRVAAAAEARLDGCPLAAMSSAGSGSKGIATILPVAEAARALNAGRLETLRALAFSHLINIYINAAVGKLSAICACATGAATGAAAAITWLLGGTDEQIGFAIRNMAGCITGVVCDGGKVGCSLKLSAAMGAAFLSATLASGNVALRPTDGICADTPEDCIKNMGRISNPGMVEADREIVRILLEKDKTPRGSAS